MRQPGPVRGVDTGVASGAAVEVLPSSPNWVSLPFFQAAAGLPDPAVGAPDAGMPDAVVRVVGEALGRHRTVQVLTY